jgi:hypothetical protein
MHAASASSFSGRGGEVSSLACLHVRRVVPVLAYADDPVRVQTGK